ncbi:hypothetical protein JD844_001028 [Phrynosoma platyrhinos]|uniref:GTP-binding protein REM 2 n=1 Tax=Phrynosoma platyrhinos TaxID=52577 RepID=A0ABQ7T9V1_PHRPL|nr:hypothetical protein JD844_001028 [Phrynosoma platyrhinos]
MALPPALPGAGPRRGSMPLPIKHQLVRASAVDELDSPPSSPEVGSNAGPSPPGGRGPYKVMLLGESGVGKTTLAAIFGGLKGGVHHEEEHTESKAIMIQFHFEILVSQEGRSLAVMMNCKHIETSAALHHNTEELFEGVVRQIRLRHHRREGEGFHKEGAVGRRESITKKAKRFLSSLVPRNGRFFKQRSKSCNDLSVL